MVLKKLKEETESCWLLTCMYTCNLPQFLTDFTVSAAAIMLILSHPGFAWASWCGLLFCLTPAGACRLQQD